LNLSIAQHRLLMFAVVAAAVAILFVPLRQFVQQRHQIATVSTSLARLRTQDAKLAAESKRLSDPNELALLARQRLGLVKPGERAYFIEPTAPPKQPAAAGQAVHHATWFGRAWHWLTSHIRGRS
jgi:cell division protein FtsB